MTMLVQRVREFAAIVTRRRGEDLDVWIDAVLADDLPVLHSFVHGLRKDHDAVTAGLTPDPEAMEIPCAHDSAPSTLTRCRLTGPINGRPARTLEWRSRPWAPMFNTFTTSAAASHRRTTMAVALLIMPADEVDVTLSVSASEN
ncbi:hypothetical protein ACQPZF_10500 [Actinosynnema sp. CS-041913]|uniref:hypothetical protein n=1 Tax=Actinosynnema sp. CS-041913 TaxID=3239917 RepID=UPI003D9030EB